MKKIIIFFILIFTSQLLASSGMHLEFKNGSIKQGQLVDAVVQMNEETAQKISELKLAGENFAETLYLYQMGPLTKSASSNIYTSEAQVIFLKVPEKPGVVHKSPAGELVITWSPVEVQPTEAAPNLIFGTFEIPSRMKLLWWVVGSLLVAGGFLGGLKYRKFSRQKKLIKEKQQNFKSQLLNATDYVQVVEIWQKRDDFLREFPEIKDHFKKFETTLFKCQFKPRQTETEKIEVMTAYREFINNIRGGLNGV